MRSGRLGQWHIADKWACQNWSYSVEGPVRNAHGDSEWNLTFDSVWHAMEFYGDWKQAIRSMDIHKGTTVASFGARVVVTVATPGYDY